MSADHLSFKEVSVWSICAQEMCLLAHFEEAAGHCLTCGVSANLLSTSESQLGALCAAGGAATVPVSRKVPHSLAEVDNGQVRALRWYAISDQRPQRSCPPLEVLMPSLLLSAAGVGLWS